MANYTPSSGDVIASGVAPATELLSNVGGFIAGCGWAGLDVILHWSKGESVAPDHVTAIIKQAVTSHQTVGREASGGQASPENIIWVAQQHGVSLQSVDYHTALAQAGQKPAEIGVSNARAFGGNDRNVAGHYVTVVGKTRTGDLITSDPNTNESAAGRFVRYSHAQYDAAQPFWAGVPSGTGGGSAPQFGSCGPYPIPSSYIGGYGNPKYWLDVAAWSACTATTTDVNAVTQGPGQLASGVSGIVGSVLSAVAGALKRIGVFVFGAILLVLGLYAAFHQSAEGTT